MVRTGLIRINDRLERRGERRGTLPGKITACNAQARQPTDPTHKRTSGYAPKKPMIMRVHEINLSSWRMNNSNISVPPRFLQPDRSGRYASVSRTGAA